jgi:Spy/CpxP family protein refolding chaperone
MGGKMNVRTLLGTAVLMVISTGLLWAQPRPDRLKIRTELNLSQKQEKALQDLHFNAAKEMIQLRSQLQLARLDLKRMMAEDEADRNLILNQVDEISRIQAEMKKLQMEKQLAFRDILDRKQLAKLKELRMERKHSFKKKRFQQEGPGKGFGPAPGGRQNWPMTGEAPFEPEVLSAPEEEITPELGSLFEPIPELDFMVEPIPPMEEFPEVE